MRHSAPTTPPLLPSASLLGRLPRRNLPGLLGRPGLLLLALLLFVLALQLLKSGSGSVDSVLLDTLRVGTAASTLGLGWLLAYNFLSGSPVAALAVTLFAAGTLDALQTFTILTGSRLGAAFVVLLVGLIANVRQQLGCPTSWAQTSRHLWIRW